MGAAAHPSVRPPKKGKERNGERLFLLEIYLLNGLVVFEDFIGGGVEDFRFFDDFYHLSSDEVAEIILFVDVYRGETETGFGG